jgi:putative tryptophan/tyrosine transport system substrate-binding protein
MASHIGRRKFLATLGGAAVAWPLAARAQQTDQVRRIGFLPGGASERDAEWQALVAAFKEGLQKLGWIDGHNVRIELRWAGADADRRQAYAAELMNFKPDVIVAGGTSALESLSQATRTIPIVFVQVSDPVRAGFVESLVRPGGNITGFALYEYAIAAKWLELLKQIAPRVTHVGVIYDPTLTVNAGQLPEIVSAAPSFGVQLSTFAVRNAAEIERAIEEFGPVPDGGLVVLPNPPTVTHRGLIVALAAKHRLPAVYPYRMYVASGGLASYGVDIADLYRRAASYVDRILKGEKPGELPVQYATKFELVINLNTAKALGLDPPISLLARTDEVIE